jgi:hypothetical protein
MNEPESFRCPHCMYAFRGDDPRYAVLPGESHRIIVCPGCRSMVRRWASGHPKKSKGCMVAIAIIIAIIVYFVCFKAS